MKSDRPLQFHGGAGGYFLVFLVVFIMTYIPFFGWAFAFNFMARWVVGNTAVNGKEVTYTAGYWQTFGFILLNFLLLIITLGIYVFWFVPKMYRYIADNTGYVAGFAPMAAPTDRQPSHPAKAAASRPAAAKPKKTSGLVQ